jgi:hypothetical protein
MEMSGTIMVRMAIIPIVQTVTIPGISAQDIRKTMATIILGQTTIGTMDSFLFL